MTYTRTSPRHQVKIEGKIMSPDMSCFFDCVIKDLSEGGAQVWTPGTSALPTRVYLWQDRTKTLFECEVRWRKLNLMGLRFLDASYRAKARALLEDAVPVPGSMRIRSALSEAGRHQAAA
jgi:hypothetical protein